MDHFVEMESVVNRKIMQHVHRIVQIMRVEMVNVIQVKMNSSQPNRGSFGYAKRFLEDDVPFFNSKPGPILADFLVMVTSVDAPKFHVFPIKVAESIARELASSWAKTLKRDGEVRSTSFPVSPVFEEIKEFRGNKVPKISAVNNGLFTRFSLKISGLESICIFENEENIIPLIKIAS